MQLAQLRVYLYPGSAILQPYNGVEVVSSALLGCFRTERCPQIYRRRWSLSSWRQNADDEISDPFEPYRLADDVGVGVERVLKQAVAQNNRTRSPYGVFRGGEAATQHGT